MACSLIYYRDVLFKKFLPKNIQVNLNDESIQKPLVPTIFSSKFICITIPCITFILLLLQQIVSIIFIENETITLNKMNTKILICFITGYSVTLLSVLLVKSMIGRKRPNFLASNGIQVDSSTGFVIVQGYRMNNLASSNQAIDEVISLITKFHPPPPSSNNNDDDSSIIWKSDSLRSFYSGHSCVPMYCAIFSLLHLHSIILTHNVPISSFQVIMETFYLLLSLYPGIGCHHCRSCIFFI